MTALHLRNSEGEMTSGLLAGGKKPDLPVSTGGSFGSRPLPIPTQEIGMAETTLIGHSSNLWFQAHRLRQSLRQTLSDLQGPRPVAVDSVPKEPGGPPPGITGALSHAHAMFDECEHLAAQIANLTNNSNVEGQMTQAGISGSGIAGRY